jgi:BolA protein
MPTIAEQLQQSISNAFTPELIEVINESRGHGGYYEGKESHFKVVIVSQAFEAVRLVKRHQLVYQACQAQLAAGVHALAMHTYTPAEWQALSQVPSSPACMGHNTGSTNS